MHSVLSGSRIQSSRASLSLRVHVPKEDSFKGGTYNKGTVRVFSRFRVYGSMYLNCICFGPNVPAYGVL